MHILLFLLFSTFLSAQQTLSEARVEENMFLMKIIGVVILLLILMPFILRQLKNLTPKPEKSTPVLDFDEDQEENKKRQKNEQEEVTKIDPVSYGVEKLFDQRATPIEKREAFKPLYRKYVEIKMGEVDVKTGSFYIDTILNAVMERVHSLDVERNFEVVFDMDTNVPSQIIGDAERMEEILFYLIENVVHKSESYIVEVDIKRQDLGDSALHLEFYIACGDESNSISFEAFDNRSTETGLELYLAKEYAKLMGGDITLEHGYGKKSVLLVKVKLYMPNPSEMRHYRLPSKTMIGHSVMIVDDHRESALAIQKMFEYFKNEVDLLSSKELFSALEMLEDYDIVVIQERYFAKHLLDRLESIKKEKDIKVVSLNKNEAFNHTEERTIMMIDGELSKPVTVQKVFNLLVLLYSEKKEV